MAMIDETSFHQSTPQPPIRRRKQRRGGNHSLLNRLFPLKRRGCASCPPTSTLATLLSSLVLVAYALCIITVVIVLDGQNINKIPGISISWSLRSKSDGGGARLLSTSENTYLADEKVPEKDPSPSLSQEDSRDDDDEGVGFVVPKATWPVTLRDEEDDFEWISHPVLTETQLHLPRFWSRPIHQNGLMTRETAMAIGTCAVPNKHGEFIRGADCPLHQRTIFVMIASYRDYQCRETVESIYLRATYPERIRVAVVDQILDGDAKCNEPIKPCEADPEQALCKYNHLVDIIFMDAKLSVGPVPARHYTYRMYRGEYYAVQSDAHVTYVNGWEVKMMLELESTGNEMAVLSTYLSDFQKAMDEDGNSIRKERPIMCNSYWKQTQGAWHVHHSVEPEDAPSIHGMPQLHPWWSAGFSFSRGHFIVNVPYDLRQPMVFSGEEMAIAIRGFTIGYDYYAPEFSACFHHYAESPEGIAKRGNVPTFWENSEQYIGVGIKGMKRLLGMIHMNPGMTIDDYDRTEEDVYGIGGVRTPDQLYSLLGINVTERKSQGHLCRFVNSGRMHNLLVPKLRNDGMGIDYSSVDYQWVDPHPETPKAEETAEPVVEDKEKETEEKVEEKQVEGDGEEEGGEDVNEDAADEEQEEEKKQ